MRLTAFSDYALRTLMYLAAQPPGAQARIADIAAAYGISETHLTKVAQMLAQGGEVAALRGRKGGLRLGRPAAEINIGAVIRRTESDLKLVECFGSGDCRIGPACTLRHVLHEALGAFFAVLDRYSLSDLMRRQREIGALLGIAPAA